MDIFTMARELGKAIQQDEAYRNMMETSAAADSCEELQAKLKRFTQIRSQLDQELIKADSQKDEKKRAELDTELRETYRSIMDDPKMVAYNMAKAQLENLLNTINQILSASANGEDPDTIDLNACTGSCSTCGGCH